VNMKEFRTTSDHIAIVPRKRVDRITTRGIILPAETRDPFVVWGDVVAVGPGYRGRKTGAIHPVVVQKGDRVLYLREGVRNTFTKIEVDGVTHEAVQLIQQRDINLIVREGEIIPLNDYLIGTIIPSESEFIELDTPNGKQRVAGKFLDLGGKPFFLPNQIEEGKQESTEKRPVKVRAIKVGEGRRTDNGSLIPPEINVGDTVLVSKYMAWEFILDDSDQETGYVVIKGDQVFGIETEAA
jgi:co-chaperonin GroES (HSP10)